MSYVLLFIVRKFLTNFISTQLVLYLKCYEPALLSNVAAFCIIKNASRFGNTSVPGSYIITLRNSKILEGISSSQEDIL